LRADYQARALANLTPADFRLDSAAPTVSLAGRFAKNKKPKVQPLPVDVAVALVDYLAGKPAGVPVWGGTWAKAHKGAEMLRMDLAAAGIPYAVEGPDGPEYADFHELRHSFLTLGGRSGIDLRTLQELAGHSKPELTARYSHRRLYDLTGAVARLPNLVPAEPTTTEGAIPLRGTGTDGIAGVPPGVPTGYAGWHSTASPGTLEGSGVNPGDPTIPLEMKRPGATQHRAASVRTQRGRRDSNPQPPDRQSHHFAF